MQAGFSFLKRALHLVFSALCIMWCFRPNRTLILSGPGAGPVALLKHPRAMLPNTTVLALAGVDILAVQCAGPVASLKHPRAILPNTTVLALAGVDILAVRCTHKAGTSGMQVGT